MNLNEFASVLASENNFIKASFGGFAGSGKTKTSCEFIAGCYVKLGCTKPVLIIDNEKGLRFLVPFFKAKNIPVLVKDTCTLADVLAAFEYMKQGLIDFLFVDSLTKVWYQFVKDYKSANRKTFMTLQDWGKIIPDWQDKFADKFVNISGNIVFTGRGGYEYEAEVNEETNKKEFFKSGVKMKMAGETPFEPDLNIWMDMVQSVEPDGSIKIHRTALVLKDRSGTIDGCVFRNPTFKHFEPVISYLVGVDKAPIAKTSDNTNLAAVDTYDSKKISKEVMLEKIQNLFTLKWPSRTDEAKQKKIKALASCFNTSSWTEVEHMKLSDIEIGHEKLELYLAETI